MSGNYFDRFDEKPKQRGSNYFDRFDAKPAKRKGTLRDVGEQFLSGLSEGVAGIADMVVQASPVGTVGNALKTAAGLAELTSGRGGANITPAPFSRQQRAVTRALPSAETSAGRASRTLGQMTPNALAPGSTPARIANVALPAAGSEIGGRIGDDYGERGEAIGRGVGALVGGFAASVRVSPNALRRPEPAARVRGQDVNALRQRTGEYRAAGVEPTLTDVVDDAGRGAIKAAANRNTPGRQVANDFARARTLNLPDRISRQARTHISDAPRSADEVVEALEELRSQTARTTYADPYSQRIEITPRVASALRGREGQNAIESAIRTAEARRDYAVLDDLRALQRAATEGLPRPMETLGVRTEQPPIPQVSGAALDRVQIELGQRARNLTRSVDNANPALAGGVTGRQRDINAGLDDVEGLREARATFRAQTRNIEAAEAADRFVRPGSADDLSAVLSQADDLQPARMVAARAVERAAGENVSAAPGVARRLADAPEQQARNRAILGEGADRFQDAMRLEARAVENAGAIAPSRGSPTFLNAADDAQMEGVARIGQQLVRRDVLGFLVDRWRPRGVSDEEAEALVRIATDPARTDEAIEIIARRMGQEEARRFLDYRNALLIGGVSSVAATP